ncbi:replication initiator protein RctB domain-containing protein [Vibrio splendidus]|uniref:replication initiator protein RctB domain-containing protein n=1 Tax=Vibrio splendidus TaxID=29497 RepID=UPI001E382A15|nr:replication initiator protein RctB domain-containing protein [Vibrio splendidus]MCC4789378.1 DUF3346 domain-containing protein [Vibrio splendidus]CAK1934938.1 DUF3346 domain-containing protein [Vibrio crassostreae]
MPIELNDISPTLLETIDLKRRFTLFLFDPVDVELFDAIQDVSLGLKQRTIAQHLISLAKSHSGISNKAFQEGVEARYEIKPATLRRTLGELKNLGFLDLHEVTHNGQLRATSNIYTLAKKTDLAIIADRDSLTDRNRPKGNKKSNRDSVKSALQKKSLSQQDVDLRPYIPKGMPYDRQILPTEYIALAPTKRNGNPKALAQFKHPKGGNYTVAAKGHEQVSTKGAIQTLMALLSLAIAYNARAMKTKRFSRPFENTECAAKLEEILYLRGLSDNGQTRDRIREQIQELRHTVYEWTDLDGVIVDDELQKLFMQKDFQFLIELETNSKIAPVINENGVEVKPTLFFYTFHPKLIEILAKKEVFFTLPKQIAVGDPLLLLFYMCLRVRRVAYDSLELSLIAEHMFFDGSENKLHNDITAALKSYKCKTGDTVKRNGKMITKDYNLCGYYISFKINQDGNYVAVIDCDEKQMIEATGSTFNEGKNNAPTLSNPLVNKFELADEMKRNVLVDALCDDLLSKYVTHTTRRFAVYRKFRLLESEYTISAYDDEHHLDRIAHLVSMDLNANKDIAVEAIHKVQGHLKKLTYGKTIIIESEHFYSLMERLETNHDIKLSKSELIDSVKLLRSKRFGQWVNGELDELAAFIASKLGQVS